MLVHWQSARYAIKMPVHHQAGGGSAFSNSLCYYVVYWWNNIKQIWNQTLQAFLSTQCFLVRPGFFILGNESPSRYHSLYAALTITWRVRHATARCSVKQSVLHSKCCFWASWISVSLAQLGEWGACAVFHRFVWVRICKGAGIA